MTRFKITSVNCRGLHDSKKRKDVFNYLRESKSSIFCLQDTHCTNSDEKSVYAQWGHDILMSAGRSDARGTLTLLNNNAEIKILTVKCDKNGNYIISNLLIENSYTITLVNLYGPNRDDPNFYNEIGNLIEDIETDFVIMCGDWNVVQDFQLDCHNYVMENNIKIGKKLKKLKNRYNLIDPWRINDPETKTYTWSRKNPLKQAQLDFFLIVNSRKC